jgi:predicted nucleic acid-binding protein
MANRSDLDAAPGVALQVASKRFSFVDALNVVVARRLGIRVLFGFDRHFFTRFRFRRWA